MPSFDVVSEVNMHEVTNAVDQANREVATRFDFKNTGSKFERNEADILLEGPSDFHLKQMRDILYGKLTKRGIDLASLQEQKIEESGKVAKQTITVRQGLEGNLAKEIVKAIKEAKMKVQAAIQGDKVRVTGNKKDDLQKVIALLKNSEFDMPLQFVNYRD
jgi:hypothetical protein